MPETECAQRLGRQRGGVSVLQMGSRDWRNVLRLLEHKGGKEERLRGARTCCFL